MKNWLFSLFVICSILGFGQKIPLEKFKGMNMRSIGPATTSGRVTAIDAVDRPGGYILAGTASGGLWKSTSGGVSWFPVFDDQTVIGIGAVKISPKTADVIWVGTGEGNPRNSQTSGKGIYKSLDAGKTWKLMGLEETKTIHRICINSFDHNVVYAAATGSAWGPNSERGVFKTTDGGSTWKKILFVNDSIGCADLIMDSQNPDKLFAAMWHYGRQPWFFNSGGNQGGLYVSVNGGQDWKKLGEKEGLPSGKIGRIGIAIAPSNSNIVYALIEAEKTALYKSVDGGSNWFMVTDKGVSDRPFYYHEFYVDPSNENHLIYLHSTVTESIDGGKTWSTLLPYYGVHPDHHAFWWSSSNPLWMIEGNDGGLNMSRDGGKNWQFAENLPLGQFYHVNYDMQMPYNVYGGLQDNGSWKGPAYSTNYGGIVDGEWREIMFGDGFDCAVIPNDPRYVYAMSQGGELSLVDTQTGESFYAKPVRHDSTQLRFNWNAALAVTEKGVYFGSQFLHFSSDRGNTWSLLSSDLTTNDKSKQKSKESGGLTIDATSAENYCTILSIAPNPLNEDVIWVGTDDGNLQLTMDRGKSWMNLSLRIKDMPEGAWIPQIVPGHRSQGEAFVVVNNYRKNDWKPYLFYTNDFGKSWKNIVSDKSVSGHCLSIAQDSKATNLLFLGTEHGLYVSIDNGENWTKWTNDYPSVATQDLKIHPRENDLIIGTFGRAIFILDDITPLRKLAQEGLKLVDKSLVALENPEGYLFAMNRPAGQRFPADGSYAGENRNYGIRLNYFLKLEEEKRDKEKKDEKENKDKQKEKLKDKKVKISILSLLGDTLRVFKHEPDTGFNCVFWYGDTNGFNWPSRKEKEDKEIPGGGFGVEPGKYKVVFSFNEFKDSSFVEVKYDPRLDFSIAAWRKGKLEYEQLRKQIERVNAVINGIRENKKLIENYKSILTFVNDSLKKEVIQGSDSLLKSMTKLESVIFSPEDWTGIRDESEFLMSDIYQAMGYISLAYHSYGGNGVRAFEILLERVGKLVTDYNTFLEKELNPWMVKTKNIQPIWGAEPKKVE